MCLQMRLVAKLRQICSRSRLMFQITDKTTLQHKVRVNPRMIFLEQSRSILESVIQKQDQWVLVEIWAVRTANIRNHSGYLLDKTQAKMAALFTSYNVQK